MPAAHIKSRPFYRALLVYYGLLFATAGFWSLDTNWVGGTPPWSTRMLVAACNGCGPFAAFLLDVSQSEVAILGHFAFIWIAWTVGLAVTELGEWPMLAHLGMGGAWLGSGWMICAVLVT